MHGVTVKFKDGLLSISTKQRN